VFLLLVYKNKLLHILKKSAKILSNVKMMKNLMNFNVFCGCFKVRIVTREVRK